jgi:hypothetical protein
VLPHGRLGLPELLAERSHVLVTFDQQADNLHPPVVGQQSEQADQMRHCIGMRLRLGCPHVSIERAWFFKHVQGTIPS